MRLLDRYVTSNFLQAYIYCIAGFLSIWLIFDISDNISTFIEQQVGVTKVIHYYLLQMPQIFVILLPIALLLALLFCLGRMSRANEIVSMLTAGVSVPRLLFPLITIGLITVGVTFALNYELGPHADIARKRILSEKSKKASVVEGQIFRNRTDARTWFVQNFRVNQNVFNNVQVLQQDATDNIVTSYLAKRAVYQEMSHTWDLEGAKVVNYDATGNVLKEEMFPLLKIDNWSETPFRLSSANVHADSMSVPELREYLHFNSDFPPTLLAPFKTHLQYRLALPWTCLVVVMMAAPLGIGFSRRGVLASVGSAVILVFLHAFLFTNLFLALGEGDRVSPLVAAWTPNFVFGLIGLYLLYLRSTNREGLGFAAFFAQRKAVAS